MSIKLDIEKLQAYLPKIFTELRHKNNWTLNQTKIFMYALSQLYKHKIKIDHTEYTNSNVEEVDIDHIPRKISISKDEIINITKLPISQFAREIRNITYGIMESVATIPSLTEPDNPKSYRQRKWFEEFEYLDGKGILIIEIDKYLLPYLVVFANYTRIKLSDIFSFKHNYSCDLYIYLKLNFNRHVSINQIRLSLIEFKSIVNMEKAYSNNTAMFQKKIIVNAVNEVNSLTDLSLDYELHKTGKRFTDITIKFSQKKDTSKEPEQSKQQPQEIDYQAKDEPLNLDVK
jgi:plasmid replication initiation protein